VGLPTPPSFFTLSRWERVSARTGEGELIPPPKQYCIVFKWIKKVEKVI
jgi:hypothetical protein